MAWRNSAAGALPPRAATPAARRRPRAAAWFAVAAIVLAGCATGPRDGAPVRSAGRLGIPPDAEPRIEPIRTSGGTSKPYTVLGRTYVPITDDRPLRERGLASWYGTQFHSRSTASGEPYDMHAMTAAHKTLPLPSYVRVRNPANDREAIVRVNDRGPFHDDRVIDLSYGAARKLDLLRGVAPVEIERITNEDIRTGAWRQGAAATFAQAAAPVQPPTPLLLPVAAGAADLRPDSPPSGLAPPPSDAAVPDVFTRPVTTPPRAEAAELPTLAAPLPPSAGAHEAPPATPPAGYWVQLGAFSQRDGALAFRNSAALDLPSLASALRVFSEGGTHRVQAGPYASREAARGAAEQVQGALRLAPVVVERR